MRIVETEDLNKELLFTIPVTQDLTIQVYTVNSEFVRNNYDNGFSGGGNWKSNSYIPENEIWLDSTEEDNLFHEFCESMGMSYFYDSTKSHEDNYIYIHEFTSMIEAFARHYYKTFFEREKNAI